MRSRVKLGFVAACGIALVIGACHNDNTPAPSPPVAGTTITIANNAVSPKNIVISTGGQVTFMNADNRPHNMQSDPHPEHTDCPALAQVGFLNPGQSRQSGNLNTVRTCGYHDHDLADVAGLQGTITVQ